MYLILYPQNSLSHGNDTYSTYCTEDMQKVADAIKKNTARVYKLDSLTEIKAIDVTYQEITKEMT